MGSKSGQQWESSGYWEPYPNDTTIATVIFETFNEAGKPQEAYGLNDIPLIPGTYSIMGSYSDEYDGFVGGIYVRLAPNGEAVLERLQVNDEKNGFVTISEYNSETKTLKGSFDMYFISENNASSVEIVDGTFEIRLLE